MLTRKGAFQYRWQDIFTGKDLRLQDGSRRFAGKEIWREKA